ncbi:hypothetical protein NDA16_004235 [Ustilago loliicola]|nr:hypothetical protein NDA16_004235 [Ustilago loliicola]
MTVALLSKTAEDPLNTVAVVPFDLAPTTSRHGASASATRPANALAAAASNLISAIAQGSGPTGTQSSIRDEAGSDAGSDQGSSSFTYHAPSSDTAEAEQQGWYASIPYHISNRYYDVDITLKATKAALSTSSQPVGEAPRGGLSGSFPAYLVVVDRTQPLEHHRQLADSLESKVVSGFDAEISIIAGVSLLSSSHPQLVTALDDEPRSTSCSRQNAPQGTKAKTSDLVALYADHGWEFIAIDELDVASLGSENGESYSDAEGEEDDTDGIERIREALMNHMWNGLVRKDQGSSSASRDLVVEEDRALDRPEMRLHQGFSESLQDANGGTEYDIDPQVASAKHSEPNSSDALGASLASLNLDNHAEASDLDEQLAELFLASSNGNGNDLAELEAFLESEDPSWPAPQPQSDQTQSTNDDPATQFDDDFDDFLPFQSGPSQPSAQAAATDSEDMPSTDQISQMQDRLFGSNAAARLEAGPLGMGSGGGAVGQDLASQLQQLQWHAEKVRNIQDPDQRRKEIALVALAFSMQWGSEGEVELRGGGAMAF